MKKLLLFICLVFGGTAIYAQASTADNAAMNSFSKLDNMKSLLSNRARNVTSFDNRYEGVKGTPFLNEDWLEGKLVLADSVLVKNKMLFKFDVLNNEVWIKYKTDEEHILYNRELLTLELFHNDGKKTKFIKFKLPENENRHHFSMAIFEGKSFILVKDMKKIFRKSNLEDKGFVTVGHAYDWFEEQANFYVRKGSDITTKVSLKKADIMEAARLSRPHTVLVEKYCKEHNLKGKLTEEEAMQLVGYMNILNE